MARKRQFASISATEHSETNIPDVTLEVRWLTGKEVCFVDLKPDVHKLQGVKEYIANFAGFCACRLQFIAGGDVVPEGLLVRRWIRNNDIPSP